MNVIIVLILVLVLCYLFMNQTTEKFANHNDIIKNFNFFSNKSLGQENINNIKKYMEDYVKENEEKLEEGLKNKPLNHPNVDDNITEHKKDHNDMLAMANDIYNKYYKFSKEYENLKDKTRIHEEVNKFKNNKSCFCAMSSQQNLQLTNDYINIINLIQKLEKIYKYHVDNLDKRDLHWIKN